MTLKPPTRYFWDKLLDLPKYAKGFRRLKKKKNQSLELTLQKIAVQYE